MIVTLGQTDNFTIEYQDNFPDARRRAQALRNSCESEFAMLMQWFAVIKHPDGTEAFGPSNRVTLQVETASFANNYGYHRDGTTKVIMNPFDTQHFPAPGEDVNQADADDAVLGLFVAEIVEVLMSYHNTRSLPGFQAWNPIGSDGEGLSRVCAALFHPTGYYNFLRGRGVNPWLQSKTSTNKRNDWVAKTEASDQDIDSFGCAILFIYYLHTQLGFSMQSIISSGSTSLEATYHILTGLTDGYSALTQLLDAYFPIGSTASIENGQPISAAGL